MTGLLFRRLAPMPLCLGGVQCPKKPGPASRSPGLSEGTNTSCVGRYSSHEGESPVTIASADYHSCQLQFFWAAKCN